VPLNVQKSARQKYPTGTPGREGPNVNSRMKQTLSRFDVQNAEFRKELLGGSTGEARKDPKRAGH